MAHAMKAPSEPGTRDKLLAAAVNRVRSQGFAATSIDQLCADAGVTKGAFFHHFASKDALGVAAAAYWSATTGALFASAPYHQLASPVARVMGYLDLRLALLQGPVEAFTCFAGTTLQESFASSETVRRACASAILDHCTALEADLAAALSECSVQDVDAASLARHVQTVIQGAFILSKAVDPVHAHEMAREAIGHLRRYFELLLSSGRPATLAGEPSNHSNLQEPQA